MRTIVLSALAATALLGQEVSLNRVAGGFTRPTDIQNAGDGSGRLFVVEQTGIIRIVKDGAVLGTPFLDITNRTRGAGERGLLGLAFPPEFARKGYFYVNFTDASSGATVISRFQVTANPEVADPRSERILLTVPQPFSNHNGGQILFGPDGYLYIGMGDSGGSGGDPQNNAQNPNALLGKMLRIDVESDPNTVRVPPDNPFVNNPSYRPEIWALGLRNPWRFSFDRLTGDLWIADVGQNRAEEVNYTPASSRGGENYGWSRMEGLRCYQPGCSQEGLVLPVVEYPRSEGISVTGGFVYRGSGSPALLGTYLYGDFGSGRLWGLRREGERFVNRLLRDTGFSISTFGQDENGEVYVADYGGAIYQIEAAGEGPVLLAESVVNAATYQPGLTPGSAASAFVSGAADPGVVSAQSIPLPETLAGVRVLVNDQAAPLYAVANLNGLEQINFQAPFEIAGWRSVRVEIERDGVRSAAVNVPVVLPAQPGVFTSDERDAIVVHATNELVTPDRPLERGETVYLYATGLGAVTNQPPTGSAGPVTPLAAAQNGVSAAIGGIPCRVPFAGLAPGLVGVYQVNLEVAEGVRSGFQELVLTVGDFGSPAVLVPVR